MITRRCFLDPVDVDSGSLEELVVKLLLLAFLVCDIALVDCHLGIGTRGAALGKSARVDDKDTVDDLESETELVLEIRTKAYREDWALGLP